MRAASLLLVAALSLTAQSGKPLSCANCHREQAQYQAQTPMGIGMELPPNQTVLAAHPKMTFAKGGYSYTVETSGGQSTYTVTDGKETLSVPIHYAFGVHIQTYVLEREGRFFESLVSYYPAVGGLAITMGDERLQPRTLLEALGRETGAQEITACFGCHSSSAAKDGRFTLDSVTPGRTGAWPSRCHPEEAKRFRGRRYVEFLRRLPPHLGNGHPHAKVGRVERALSTVPAGQQQVLQWSRPAHCLHRLPRSASQSGSQ